MNQYDPNESLVAEDWLKLDEDERVELVMNFHEQYNDSLPNIQAHAFIHVIVENQLALGAEGVAQAIARLTRQGLERHEAVHAIGAVLAEDAFKLVKGERDNWDHQGYRKRLENLTAKRWLKRQY